MTMKYEQPSNQMHLKFWTATRQIQLIQLRWVVQFLPNWPIDSSGFHVFSCSGTAKQWVVEHLSLGALSRVEADHTHLVIDSHD